MTPGTDPFCIISLEEVDSTNTYLKRLAPQLKAARSEEDAPWRAVIASSQQAGRGRMGRTFVSPAGTGVYLSVFLTPRLSARQAVRITTAAAVAACRAIEACTDREPEIKWVNDILIDGKKACGILTEASIDLESGGMDWAIMGIGFNVSGICMRKASWFLSVIPKHTWDWDSRCTWPCQCWKYR